MTQILNQIETDPTMKKEPFRLYTLDGGQEWRLNNVLHRENGPAVIRPFIERKTAGIQGRSFTQNIEEWWLYGRRHREDGPAYTSPNLHQWWFNGLSHRADGPAQTIYEGKAIDKETYYVNGRIHRWDGPAIIDHHNSTEEWWVDGRPMECLKDLLAHHCIEGPFTEWTEGEWLILRFALSEDLAKKRQ